MDVGVSSIHQKKVLQDLEDYEIQAGDIVLVLEKQKDRTKVMIPYGDFPSVYSYISCKTEKIYRAVISRRYCSGCRGRLFYQMGCAP